MDSEFIPDLLFYESRKCIIPTGTKWRTSKFHSEQAINNKIFEITLTVFSTSFCFIMRKYFQVYFNAAKLFCIKS